MCYSGMRRKLDAAVLRGASTRIGRRHFRIRCVAPCASDFLADRGKGYRFPDERMARAIGELDLGLLMASAAAIRDAGADSGVSPKASIPLTRPCRDSCGYCTFARSPKPGKAVYMSIDEVLGMASRAVELGCTEALFTLGDNPELLYPQAKQELAARGHSTTVEYVAEVAKLVLETTGLLPHINAGVMSKDEALLLRKVSVSQGFMLESTALSLLEPGAPHLNCPDKVPSARLASIAVAGESMVPFTTGLLVGNTTSPHSHKIVLSKPENKPLSLVL